MMFTTLLLLFDLTAATGWEQLQESGLDAMRQGHYRQAANLFHAANARMPSGVGSAGWSARLLSNEGAAWQQAGEYKRALEKLEQALAAWKLVADAAPDEIARTHNNIAVLYRQQWNLTAAAKHAERAMELNPTPVAWHTLAEIHRLAGHFIEADAALTQSARLLSQAPDLLVEANLFQSRGSLLADQDQLDQAEPFFRSAADLLEKELGRDHPVTLAAYNNLGQTLLAQRRAEEAETILTAQLALFEKSLGGMHPRTAVAANNLAQLYRLQRRYEQADQLYRKALDIWAAVFGADHPEYAKGLHNLASLFVEQGKLNGAEKLYRQAVRIATKSLGAQHPQTRLHLSGLESMYLAAKRYTEVERIRREIR